MENDCIFYDRLEYLTAIWYNLWPFDIVCGHLVYFSRWTKKNLATLRLNNPTADRGLVDRTVSGDQAGQISLPKNRPKFSAYINCSWKSCPQM
jgi:hypothetical protein